MNKRELESILELYGVQAEVVVYSPVVVERSVVFATAENGPSNLGNWVVVELAGKHIYLMDSFGTVPEAPLYDIPFWDDLTRGKTVLHNVLTGQRFGTVYCGLYCTAYLKLRDEGLSWSEACATLFPETGKDRDNSDTLSKVLGADPDYLLQISRPLSRAADEQVHLAN